MGNKIVIPEWACRGSSSLIIDFMACLNDRGLARIMSFIFNKYLQKATYSLQNLKHHDYAAAKPNHF